MHNSAYLKINPNFQLSSEWLLSSNAKLLEDKEIQDFKTPEVVTTGKVDVLKIYIYWKESSQWLLQTSLAWLGTTDQ